MAMLRSLALILAGLVFLSACATNPATGQRTFTALMSTDQEREIGAREHPKLVQQFGGEYEDRRLAAYVSGIGQALARTTETPDVPFTFTVLNDATANAFALPGGYVYVSRGLLAIADSEAELAGVLAHEIGHVVARHSAERYSRQVAAGLGAAVLGAVGAAAGLPGTSDVAAFGAQAYLQSYSREQELEADMLAVRYMTRAGYDPNAMASFFEKLQRDTQLRAALAGRASAADRFDIMASHPRTGDRIQQAIRLAGDAAPASATPQRAPRVGREDYLAAIDGLVYGDDPAQGVRIGRDFLHPTLRIAFRAPEGFALLNTPSAVIARGPEGSVIAFDMERSETARRVASLPAYVGQSWGGQLGLRNIERIDVNGMEGATGAGRVQARGGQADVRLVAIREAPDRLYRFVFVTPPQLTGPFATELQRTTFSFRRLTPSEAAAIRPLRIRTVTVRQGDTAERLAARMPFSDAPLERFLALNGLQRGEALRPGQTLKTVSTQ